MNKRKGTWLALLPSVASLLLCATMLIGSTYAWFTDTSIAPNNKGGSGNMALSLFRIDTDSGGNLIGTDITNATLPVFSGSSLEPGGEAMVSFKLENTGMLAMRWQRHFVSSTRDNKLAKMIDVYAFTNSEAIDPTKGSSFYADKLGARLGTLNDLYYGYGFFNGVLHESGDEDYFALVFKLADDLDESYQGLNAGSFDIRIITAQAAFENDTYDHLYDNVLYVTSRDDFVEAEFGGKIVMPCDVYYHNDDPSSAAWMLLDSKSEIDFDGEGNTITLLRTDDGYPPAFNHNYLAFLTAAKTDMMVSNLTVTGTGFVAIGDHDIKPAGNYTVNNLVVADMCTTHAVGDGQVVAHAFGAYGTTTLNNCIMTGTTSRDVTNAYDIGLPNGTRTTINGGEYGKMYCWAQAHVTIYDAKIGTIDSKALAYNNLGSMVIGAGTEVDTINVVKTGSFKSSLIIMPGARVGTINYNGASYTMDEWITANPLGLQP
jgi:hypothetical protein